MLESGNPSALAEDATSVDDLRVCWSPSPEQVQNSNLSRFMARAGVDDYEGLLRWSVEDLERFWRAVDRDLGLEWYEPYQQVMDTSRGIEWTRWWSGARFNYVHNALDKRALGADADRIALRWEGEEGATRTLTYRELYEETNRCANALRALGIRKGDRVGLFLPMVPEVVAAQLALGKLGAIYTPIFSGFGADAVAARLQDCEASLLITCDGVLRRGKSVPVKEVADEAVASSPSVRHMLVLRRTGREDVPWTEGRDVWWHEAVATQSRICETERTEPEDPYMVIYTSGTTGKPKGIVHVHGGFPIKGAQDMAQLFDVQPTDTFFWMTDMGWMMGPWVIGGSLILGATVLLYDGTPDYPAPDRLWSIVERHGVTVLGLAPTAIRSLMRSGNEWVTRHNLSSLRILGSSGEPWNASAWRWYQDVVGGGRSPLINYSGGTEISGGIVACTPITPEKPTSFTGPVPGIDADVVDDQGRPVRGAVGELIIRQPWPGMARGFWREPDRYLETYWARWPGIWLHGDWARVDRDGFWYIQGRSDDTIKVAGKRLGPAEVESAAVSQGQVAEAAAVGIPHPLKGETVVLFCVPRSDAIDRDQLIAAIGASVTRALGKALKPDRVLLVRELPKTRSGKVMRRVIRAIYLGHEPGDLSSLDNATALTEIAAVR